MYGLHVILHGTLDAVEAQVTQALQGCGFTVLRRIDLAATLKQTLSVEHPPYRILGACHAELARDAVAADPDIGVLLPSNVVLRLAEDGAVIVVMQDPRQAWGHSPRPGVAELAERARALLEQVRAALH